MNEMTSLKVEEFMRNPGWELFENLLKEELLILAKKLEVSSVTPSQRKYEIKVILEEILISTGQLPKEKYYDVKTDIGIQSSLELKRLEIADREKERQHEIELRQHEIELRQHDNIEKERQHTYELELRQHELRNRELELRTRELELQTAVARNERPPPQEPVQRFDPARCIRLVPKFTEDNLAKYFEHFEKVASSLEWPKEHWSLMLQSVISGKAQEAYAALSADDSKDYDTVKAALLKAYELVPEAYRQKFRECRKQYSETFVEFAHRKELLFKRWCESRLVESDFEKLRQLVLIEEFKNCVSPDIRTYLDEKDVTELSVAATLADDYHITHKKPSGPIISGHFNNYNNPNYGWVGPPRRGRGGGNGRFNGNNRSSYNNNSRGNFSGNNGAKSKLVCSFCNRTGHLMSDCYKLQGKRPERNVSSEQDGLTVIQSPVKFDVPYKESFKPFVNDGYVSLDETSVQVGVKILRDTGASQSLILDGVLPFSSTTYTGQNVLLQGVGPEILEVPLHTINLSCELVNRSVTIGVMSKLPVSGVSLLLGNDLAGGKVLVNPVVSMTPIADPKVEESDVFVHPACVTTRQMSRNEVVSQDELVSSKYLPEEESHTLDGTFLKNIFEGTGCTLPSNDLSGKKLINLQTSSDDLIKLREQAAPDVAGLHDSPVGFYYHGGILMRKWRPSDISADSEWSVKYQIVVPPEYRVEILKMAHENPLGGHLGIKKTYCRILDCFFWPGLRTSVASYCSTCRVCQEGGKPNQVIPPAPLIPVPAFGEPFSEVLCDCVGPLPRTSSGKEYLITIMCKATRFPEAIPVSNIKAPTVCKELAKFFTTYGLPLDLQSDQGSNYISRLFQQVMYQLNIKQSPSSAYHPESQGALERFHQTFKSMLRAYCSENQKDWDQGVPFLLFAIRDSVQESLGFSPFELVFGHKVRGPLKLLKDKWLSRSNDVNLLKYVIEFRNRMHEAWQFARKNLKDSQTRMKTWYDRKARNRVFRPGDRVLVLFPIKGSALSAKFHGPYVIKSKLNDVDYVLETPDRRKSTQICHINMLKLFKQRPEPEVVGVNTVNSESSVEPGSEPDFDDHAGIRPGFNNSEIMKSLDEKLCHLEPCQRCELTSLINQYKHLFTDKPGLTTLAYHDVDVGDSPPVKENPYRLNPVKADIMKNEVISMMKMDCAETSESEWSSPCILVPKPPTTKWRFVTDYRKVNSVTKGDSFPMPRVDDLIDRIGRAKYVTKFDLTKGYWQVPLTERAKLISAFCTPDGLFQYRVMPFGMKNSAATFQRLMNKVVRGLVFVVVYLDDIIVFSDTWDEHMAHIRTVFERLTEANLTVNLEKTEFVKATVKYLGHIVGQGQVRPLDAKVKAVVEFPVPTDKRSLMRFLGMSGFYRKFCKNYAQVTCSLTDLLKKDRKFVWNEQCQRSFEMVKSLLVSAPVLSAPDFQKQFKIVVDASDLGAGAMLCQDDEFGIEHPVAYFSKKFVAAQLNYATIEKECLGLILALEHFDVYASMTLFPVVVFTDHNPLVFINRMKNRNRRLMKWSLLLQNYQLQIHHIKGRDNVVADALSRIW